MLQEKQMDCGECTRVMKRINTTIIMELVQPIKDEITVRVNGSQDAYSWNVALFQVMEEFYRVACNYNLKRGHEPNKLLEDIMVWCSQCSTVIAHNPVLLVDPNLENLITDTAPAIESFKLPYNTFFINKIFPIGNGFVMGVYVYDYIELFIQQLKRNRNYTKMREVIRERDSMIVDTENCNDNRVILACVYKREDQLMFTFKSVGMITNPHKYKKVCKDNEFSVLMEEIEKQVLNYAVNLSNLINLHADVSNPTNPKKDLQIIPYQPTDKNGVKIKKIKNMSTIRVSGLIKDYAEQYNTALQMHNGSSLDATHVRGHYRTFHSERYTKMYGKTMWIPPYVRGSDKELYSKLVKITGS